MVGAFLLREILAGASYLLTVWSGWQAHIGESQSLFRLPLGEALSQLSMQMSWLVFILPFSWWILFRHVRPLSGMHVVLLLTTLVFIAMGNMQIRYLPYLALWLGLMIALVVDHLMKHWRQAVVVSVGAIFIGVGYYPCLQAIGPKDITFNVFNQLHPVLLWLQENSPPTSNYQNPTAPGEYGVLAEWSLGHYIQYYGQRPTLADNFGEHASDLQRLNQFFFSQDNQKAYQILDKHRVRYVLCRDLVFTFQSLIGKNQVEDYIASGSTIGKSTHQINFSPKIFPTVLYRLIWRYGSAVFDRQGTYYPPLERLRLVTESVGKDEQIMGGPEIALIKLFEYVPGAQIEVSGLPLKSKVTLQGIVHTPHGRWFPYIQIVKSDSSGNLSMIVPYSNDKEEGIPYVDRYILRYGDDSRFLRNINDDMILKGETIHLNW